MVAERGLNAPSDNGPPSTDRALQHVIIIKLPSSAIPTSANSYKICSKLDIPRESSRSVHHPFSLRHSRQELARGRAEEAAEACERGPRQHRARLPRGGKRGRVPELWDGRAAERIVAGDVPVEALDAGGEWLGVRDYRVRLAGAGLSRAICRVAAGVRVTAALPGIPNILDLIGLA